MSRAAKELAAHLQADESPTTRAGMHALGLALSHEDGRSRMQTSDLVTVDEGPRVMRRDSPLGHYNNLKGVLRVQADILTRLR